MIIFVILSHGVVWRLAARTNFTCGFIISIHRIPYEKHKILTIGIRHLKTMLFHGFNIESHNTFPRVYSCVHVRRTADQTQRLYCLNLLNFHDTCSQYAHSGCVRSSSTIHVNKPLRFVHACEFKTICCGSAVRYTVQSIQGQNTWAYFMSVISVSVICMWSYQITYWKIKWRRTKKKPLKRMK